MKSFSIKQLFVVMIALLCSVAASAHDFMVDGIFYNINNSYSLKVAVTYKGSSSDAFSNEYKGSVIIPESVTYNEKTYSVTSIGYSAFRGCSGLTSVTIPNSVTSIGELAFYNCSGLKSVTIGSGVTSIGKEAFSKCGYLESVTIPNSVTSIGYRAFYYCSGLKSVTIGNSVTSIGNSAFSNCSGLTSIEIPTSVTSIEDGAFYSCSGLTSVEIGNSVTSIGGYAFSNCSGLESVTIGNGVTSIGNNAFSWCSGLTSITIPNSVTSIEDGAFSGCSGLTSVIVESGNPEYDSRDNCNALIETSTNTLIKGCNNTVIPNSVTSIGNDAFYYCSGLTSVTIPNSVTSIGQSAFSNCSGLTSVTIPNSVTSIESRAFNNCSGLTSITIPNSVTSIGSYAFGYCSGLTSVTIGNSVTSIGDYAFSSCNSLTSVTIPNSVASIGELAFYDCDGLTSVTIPNSVTSIGYRAFYNCSGLKTIICKSETPATLGSGAFSSSYSSATLVVPNDAAVSAYKAANEWKRFNKIVCENPAPKLAVAALSTYPGSELVIPVEMKNDEEITAIQFDLYLPDGITVATNEDEEYMVTLADDRKTSSHTITATRQGDGAIRVIAYSDSKKPFNGNEGILVNITTKVSNAIAAGNYSVEFKNIEYTTPDEKSLHFINVSSTLQVNETVLQCYSAVVNCGTGGEALLSASSVNSGDPLKLLIAPNDGYKVSSLLLNGSKVNVKNNIYNIASVTENVVFDVEFTQAKPDTIVVEKIVTDTIEIETIETDTIYLSEINEIPVPEITFVDGMLNISCALQGVKIFYCIDGTFPDKEYTVPVAVDKDCVVTAIAAFVSDATTKETIGTGIGGVTDEIISCRYFTETGVEIDEPREGVNIMIIKYASGKTETKKVVVRKK